MKRIYLDYAASTPMDRRVFEVMQPYFSERFGNPGSLHAFGQEAVAAVDRARETISGAIGAGFREIIFTGSATEANSLALLGTLRAASRRENAPSRIIISAIEHESVLETARAAEAMGVEIIFIPVTGAGTVDKKKIKDSLTKNTVLVSLIYANNEIGTVQEIAEIGEIIKNFRGKDAYPLFHTDASQAFQYFDCDVKSLGVDLMTFSAHKIYGPKGVGALYVRGLQLLAPIIYGGGQEFGLRSGTENVPAIVGFAEAVVLARAAREKESARILKLRNELWEGIKNIFPEAEINGSAHDGEKLPNILNVYFPGHAAQDLLTKFDLKGLAASSGSACRSRSFTSSYVIEALGHSRARAASSIRFSLGRPTKEKDIKDALAIIKTAL